MYDSGMVQKVAAALVFGLTIQVHGQWVTSLIHQIDPNAGFSFGAPSQFAGQVVYTHQGGVFQGAAYVVPPASGVSGEVSYDGQTLTMRRSLGNGYGVFSLSGGQTTTLFASGATLPGMGVVSDIGSPSRDGLNAVFKASTTTSHSGVLHWNGGTVKVLARDGTPVPNGTGAFSTFQDPQVRAGRVTFIGSGGGHGIYEQDLDGAQQLSVAVDVNTAPPDGGNFIGFQHHAFDGSNLAFLATNSNTPGNAASIYTKTNGQFQLALTISQLYTLVGLSPFDRSTSITGLSISGDTIAASVFSSYFGSSSNSYVIARRGGVWSVVAAGQSIPQAHQGYGVILGPESLRGDRFAFSESVGYDIGRSLSRMKVATYIPVPGTIIAMPLFIVALARRARPSGNGWWPGPQKSPRN